MENQAQDTAKFLFRRLTESEQAPNWAIIVPVLFAFMVVALIVMFRQEKKLLAAVIGGAVVGVIALVYIPLSLLLVKVFSWMVILIPVMGVAFFYVVLMYIRDAKSVHWLWATFLGLLRTTVYLILATVFLLPGCQHSDTIEYESKVLMLFDVSDSMNNKDDRPEPGQKPEDLKTRQDKVLTFLTSPAKGKSFLDQAVDKTRLDAYRFGETLDENEIITLAARKENAVVNADWQRFLNPDKKHVKEPNVKDLPDEEAKKKLEQYVERLKLMESIKLGTNYGGAAMAMHKIENSSYLQAIIIVGDGQTNKGSNDAHSDFIARVMDPKRPIPVFTIGVGEFRLPTTIRIEDLNAPEETRPDDAFPVRVPVVSTGLPGHKFMVSLEMKRIKDATGKPVNEAPIPLKDLPPKEGVFKGKATGDQQQAILSFEIDLQKLKNIESKKDTEGLLEGEWRFQAKTPRHPDEAFLEDYHVSEPVIVRVQKRALRILMFAGGSTREYQFLRSILYREMKEGRMEMCIHNQSTLKDPDHVDQDVDPERMLANFPTTIGLNKAEKFMSLSDYDVIIAFDPDWTQLSEKQRKNLNEWVGKNAGGLIFVAGPVYSYQLRQTSTDLAKVMELLPVVLKDARLHGIGLPEKTLNHDPTKPYSLNFTPAAKEYDFLKLVEDAKSPIAGWNDFFFNNDDIDPVEAKATRPRKGFFTYYPVERIKTATEVIATFNGPKESRIGDQKDDFKDEQPFIAALRYGNGKSLYLSSGEFWRMRVKEGFHERLWIKMARYVAAGAKEQKKYGRILMARTAPVGKIEFEAQIKGSDLLPLSADLRPTVLVRPILKKGDVGDEGKDPKDGKPTGKGGPQKFDLQPKPSEGEWDGYFLGSVTLTEPGEYEFRVPIPGVEGEYLKQNVIVRKPNPEADNMRPNFGYLYQLATPAEPVLKTLPTDVRRKVESLLQVPEGQSAAGQKRLFFHLQSADAILECLTPVPPKTDTVKGRFEDVWDSGPISENKLYLFYAVMLTPLIVGVIGAIILLALKQWLAAIAFFGVSVLLSVLGVTYCFAPLFTLIVLGGLTAFAGLGYAVYLAVKQDLIGIAVLLVAGILLAGVVGFLAWRLPDGFVESFATSLRNDSLPLGFSFLMGVLVGLVGLEWLTRKLLRLA